jgi:hypothetical protein
VTRIVGGAALRPILIINFLTGICIRPQRAAPSVGATAPPAVDKGKFTRAIQSSLAATIKHQPHPVIHVLSFPQPTAPLGALVAINPNFILFLDMDAKVASPSEWQLFMPQLDTKALRAPLVPLSGPGARTPVHRKVSVLSRYFVRARDRQP